MRSGLFDRFDVRPLLLDHIRSLRKFSDDKVDLGARLLLFGAPITVVGLSVWQRWRLTDPGSLLAASSLLAGILFAAFTQLATLRDRMETRPEFAVDERGRRHFRETAAHLMTGSLIAAVQAAVLVVASGTRPNPDAKIDWISTAIFLGLGTYLFLLFVAAARRMYSAYLRAFEDGQYLRKRQGSREPSTDQEGVVG